jgi:hypothetical protein
MSVFIMRRPHHHRHHHRASLAAVRAPTPLPKKLTGTPSSLYLPSSLSLYIYRYPSIYLFLYSFLVPPCSPHCCFRCSRRLRPFAGGYAHTWNRLPRLWLFSFLLLLQPPTMVDNSSSSHRPNGNVSYHIIPNHLPFDWAVSCLVFRACYVESGGNNNRTRTSQHAHRPTARLNFSLSLSLSL